MTRRRLAAALAAAAATALVTAPASYAAPGGVGTDNRNNNTSAKLRQAASAEGALEHLRALQAIADRNDDTAPPARRATRRAATTS